jgi:PAS domain S-box-containing protein
MIYGLDPAYRVVVWNEQCERVTGYFQAEMVNDPRALDRLYPDPGRVRDMLDRLASAGQYAEYEAGPVTHHFKDDNRRTVSWLYRLNRSPLGEVRIWAIGIDLTEIYEANHALTQNEDRFRAISQATNDVLWDWDLQTDMVWWGSGMSRLFGHVLSQRASHINWWVDHMHPDDRERVFARIRDHINRKEEFWLDEYRFRRNDNSYASVLDKGRIMLDAQGQPFRMVGGIRDVTDLEIALEKIQLRDRQLAEVSFYNSHKVRAPLARLMGLVQLLRMDPDTSAGEQQELLEKIKNAAEELDYLIKNINQLLH